MFSHLPETSFYAKVGTVKSLDTFAKESALLTVANNLSVRVVLCLALALFVKAKPSQRRAASPNAAKCEDACDFETRRPFTSRLAR